MLELMPHGLLLLHCAVNGFLHLVMDLDRKQITAKDCGSEATVQPAGMLCIQAIHTDSLSYACNACSEAELLQLCVVLSCFCQWS